MAVKKTTKQVVETLRATGWDGNVTEWREYGGLWIGDKLPSGAIVRYIFAHGRTGCVWMVISNGNDWYEVDLAYEIRYDTIPF